MARRRTITGETTPVNDPTTERLLYVTVSQDHLARLQELATEYGSSVAVVSKQLMAQAVEQTIAATPAPTTEEN